MLFRSVSAAGLPELIAGSPEEYRTMAVELARSPGRLASLRAKLDAQRLACALFDTARYVRHLEAAYRGMVARQRAGQPPEHFSA